MVAFSYATRPAKHIQRRLLVDACRRLAGFAPLTDYRYVGFGGLEFIDFDLVRRELGIVDMVSIEKNTNAYARFEFNRPFAGIELLGGLASEHLPALEWAGLNIVWLDYEQRLNRDIIADVSFLARVLSGGSVLVVTVNARTPTPRNARRATLAEDVGEERIPSGVSDDSLGKWGYAWAQRQILADVIGTASAARADRARFEQLFDFWYADEAPMQTYGGIIVSPPTTRAFENCRFDELRFIRQRGAEALEIVVPVLTAREQMHLNRQLPRPEGETLDAEGISEEERAAYQAFHRWYPALR